MVQLALATAWAHVSLKQACCLQVPLKANPREQHMRGRCLWVLSWPSAKQGWPPFAKQGTPLLAPQLGGPSPLEANTGKRQATTQKRTIGCCTCPGKRKLALNDMRNGCAAVFATVCPQSALSLGMFAEAKVRTGVGNTSPPLCPRPL